MKILLATETLLTGGAETFIVRLANTLAGEHEVKLFVFYADLINGEIKNQLAPDVSLITPQLPLKKIISKFDSLFHKLNMSSSLVDGMLAKELLSIINTFQPDVVHSHLFKTDMLVANIKPQAAKQFRHITTIHGDYSAYYFGTTKAQVVNVKNKMQQVIAGLEGIVCICDEHLEFFKNNFPEYFNKTKKIYNGYLPVNNAYLQKTKAQLNLPAGRFLFVMVSRMVRLKGWDKAVDAFLQLNPPNASLVLVGDGEYLRELKAKTTDPRIIFTGFTPTPVEYIQHADVCLLPSLFPYESLPTVVMEYLFCKKPVIATHVGEIPKMITTPQNELAGILLSFTNQDVKMEELAAAMQTCLQDAEKMKAFESCAAAAFDKFDMARCTEAYIALYKKGIA